MFYPIIIPIGNASDFEYSYPTWVGVFFIFATCATVFGLAMAAISAIVDYELDIDLERFYKLGIALFLVGLTMLVISIPLLLFTGVRVE